MNLCFDSERDIMISLKDTALMMCNDPTGHRYELVEMLQMLRMNLGDDTVTYEAMRDGLETELEEKTLQRTCTNLNKKLRDYFAYEKSQEILQNFAKKAKFEPERIGSWPKFYQQLQSELE